MTSALVKWPKVMLVGDSQTQKGSSKESGWVPLTADHFQRRCDVINRGFAGYNSRWLRLMMIEGELLDFEMAADVEALTIFLGSNDAALPDLDPQNHVPLDEYKQSLKDIVVYLQSLGLDKGKVILISPPPFDAKQRIEYIKEQGWTVPPNRNNKVTGKYAAACCEAAEELEIDYIDLYSIMMKDQDWPRYLQGDGLHLGPAGGELLAQLLIPKLETRVRKDQLFPDWTQINNDHPIV